MTKKTEISNVYLRNLIEDLRVLSRKDNVKLWKRIADDLGKSRRQRREVNLRTINLYCKDNEIIIVPGKVLGDGELNKKVTIAAWRFSDKAKESINKIGKTLTIREFMKQNPKGKKVRIIG